MFSQILPSAAFPYYIYPSDTLASPKASQVYLCAHNGTKINLVSGSFWDPLFCLSEAFNGSCSWPSTDANQTEWQSLWNRVPPPPPPSILFRGTESHSVLVQRQHRWNWYPIPIFVTLLPIIICVFALKWHWTHHQTVFQPALFSLDRKLSHVSVVVKVHDMQEGVDN